MGRATFFCFVFPPELTIKSLLHLVFRADTQFLCSACFVYQNGPNADGDVFSQSQVLRKKHISIEATHPEVKLPAGHDGEGWIALDGKRLIVKTRCGVTRCGAP